MAYSVSIYGEDIRKIRGLVKWLHHPELKEVLSRSATNLVRESLFSYNRTHPNQLGGTRTNFYGQAARGTSYFIEPTAIVVSINHVGIRQQWQGGTVSAGVGLSRVTGKPTRYLTIPAIAAAHGRRAGYFDNLVLAWGRNGPYALVEAAASLTKSRRVKIKPGEIVSEKKKAVVGGRVYYWLTPSITYRGNPDILPTKKEFGDDLDKTSETFIQRKAWGK